MTVSLITTTDALCAFCDELAQAPFVTIDTEFMREKTFWPQLCLVQVAGPTQAAAIDPLATGIDLAPLYALLDNPDIMKVFHAARQDIEIFLHATGKIPRPVFDTQIAAMVCGFGESVSYENLVTRLVSARIDKTSRFTDWSHRPLTERQLAYALADVVHLRPAFEKLRTMLDKNGRAHWLEEEIGQLTDPGTYQVAPDQAWRRIKVRNPKPRFLAILKELAEWRELEAQRRDLPRGRLARDEVLMEIAAHAPTSIDDLARTRGFGRPQAEGRLGADILAAVQRGLAVPAALCPTVAPREESPPGLAAMVDLFRVLLKLKGDEHQVAPRLIAGSDDLEALATCSLDPAHQAGLPALQGWRREIFGDVALALRQGHLALTLRKGRVALVPGPVEARSGDDA